MQCQAKLVARGLASRLRLKHRRTEAAGRGRSRRQGPGISVEIETDHHAPHNSAGLDVARGLASRLRLKHCVLICSANWRAVARGLASRLRLKLGAGFVLALFIFRSPGAWHLG